MKQFFLVFFAALAAMAAGFIILVVFSIVALTATMVSVGTRQTTITPDNSVLKINMREVVTDSPSSSLFGNINPYTFTITPTLTMLDVISSVEYAATDPKINGIYLNIDPSLSIGLSNTQELRAALEKFRTSGKFIVSYNDFYTQSTYYLSSVSNKIFMNPEGDITWKGMSSQVLFFKGVLDKLGINAEVVRCGDYKSAIEPFISDKMSPESRRQTQSLLRSIWSGLLSDISVSRGVDSAALDRYATELSIEGAYSAQRLGLIDSVAYLDQVGDYIDSLIGKEAKYVSLSNYANTFYNKSKNKVAVIYADGDIIDGDSQEGMVGSRTLIRELMTLRDDDKVKAVVFRINSPGGSALASEVIWREVQRLREEKPVVVSMGNSAASGGYYIASPADLILADRATITGSIGVFGIMFDASKALKDKLGVSVDVVSTNPHADLMTPFRAQNSAEKRYLQNRVDSIYSSFVDHVAAGRNLSRAKVLEIAGGRVYSGEEAIEIGLVDGIGGLSDAILIAADRAGVVDNFEITNSSSSQDRVSLLIKSLIGGGMTIFRSTVPDIIKEYDNIENFIKRQGVQAVMPMRLKIE